MCSWFYRLFTIVMWQLGWGEDRLCHMVNSQSSRIALGRYDPFRRTPSVEIKDGQMKFLPGQGAQDQFQTTMATFPPGSRVEYRVQRGDMYFAGDHGQALARTLWVIEPNGSRKLLASGFVIYINPLVAARNLEKVGIPFRAVIFYEGANGEPVETKISTSHLRLRLSVGLLLASSNLWLGLFAGLLIRSISYLIGVGTVGFLILAVVRVRAASSKKGALLKIISTLPIYATGYGVTIVLVRVMVGR